MHSNPVSSILTCQLKQPHWARCKPFVSSLEQDSEAHTCYILEGAMAREATSYTGVHLTNTTAVLTCPSVRCSSFSHRNWWKGTSSILFPRAQSLDSPSGNSLPKEIPVTLVRNPP